MKKFVLVCMVIIAVVISQSMFAQDKPVEKKVEKVVKVKKSAKILKFFIFFTFILHSGPPSKKST